MQTQDYNGFGTQFMPIPMFKTNDNPSAPTWILFSLISGSKELWQVINTKESHFRWTGWEGWVLTAIQYYCFKNNTITIDKNSPFKKPTAMSDIVEKINHFVQGNTDLYLCMRHYFLVEIMKILC